MHGYHRRTLADVPLDLRRVGLVVRVRCLVYPTHGCRRRFRKQVRGVLEARWFDGNLHCSARIAWYGGPSFLVAVSVLGQMSLLSLSRSWLRHRHSGAVLVGSGVEAGFRRSPGNKGHMPRCDRAELSRLLRLGQRLCWTSPLQRFLRTSLPWK